MEENEQVVSGVEPCTRAESSRSILQVFRFRSLNADLSESTPRCVPCTAAARRKISLQIPNKAQKADI
jgi:hypothetical protein